MITGFDVKSLNSSKPIKEAVEQIPATQKNFLYQMFDLLRHCLKNDYFVYCHQFYRQQKKGAGMGSSLLPTNTMLYMIHLEQNTFQTTREIVF